jgi:hypothetical protein
MLTILIAIAAQAAQPQTGSPVLKRGGEIATGPVRDVGVAKTEIPPVLARAAANPYSLGGTANCAQIRSGMNALSAALGTDFTAHPPGRENRAGKLAEAGGKTLVNGLLPFRSLVREISGAAPAQRRLNYAVDAGYARRGFLRGLAVGRKCQRN